ncbi:hypothetical protein L9F63_025346, partial [Diploptera punctata]
SLLKLLPITVEFFGRLYQIPLLRLYRKHDRSLQATILRKMCLNKTLSAENAFYCLMRSNIRPLGSHANTLVFTQITSNHCCKGFKLHRLPSGVPSPLKENNDSRLADFMNILQEMCNFLPGVISSWATAHLDHRRDRPIFVKMSGINTNNQYRAHVQIYDTQKLQIVKKFKTFRYKKRFLSTIANEEMRLEVRVEKKVMYLETENKVHIARTEIIYNGQREAWKRTVITSALHAEGADGGLPYIDVHRIITTKIAV